MFKNSFWLTVLFTVFCPITCASTAYPQSTVRIIVPWATGGSTDLLARLLADNLRLQYSQNFVVDNRSGASGNIGSEIVAKAKPDGHTLLLGVMSTHVVNPIIMSQMPFDGVDDFSPIANVGVSTTALVVQASLPVNNLAEFFAYARANPGKIAYGTSGEGSPTHLGTALLAKMAKIELVHVPYRGGGPAMIDLLGGQIQMMLTSVNIAMPHVKAGKLKLLAVSEPKRAEILPNTPAINEVIANYDYSLYLGLFGPKGMPRDLIMQINMDVNRILMRADIKEKLTTLGIESSNEAPEALGRILRAERDKWVPVVREIGLGSK